MTAASIRPEDCPEPFWHETHRYCPVCSWMEAYTPVTGAELTFAQLAAVNRARCERWHPGFPLDGLWNGADWSNAMCGEAGELANVVQKLRRLECASHTNLVGGADRDDLMEKLADEMGDVVAYLDLLATFYGIDLAEAVKDKFNRVSERQGFPERLP